MNKDFDQEAQEAVKKLTLGQLDSVRHRRKKFYLGHEQREGWSGALPFYLFWCEQCGEFAKDYPHSYIDRRYLMCSSCAARYSFVPWWASLALFWQGITRASGR